MADSIRLGIIGHGGRMGRALLAYLESCPDVEAAATLGSADDLEAFLQAGPQVVVDLSVGHAVDQHGPRIVDAGIPYIVGATAYSAETLETLRRLSAEKTTPVLIVPNFSLGANLMIRFSAAAATLMGYPVVTERHHAGKADAPSGTAMFTARRIEAALANPAARDDVSTTQRFAESLPGALGAALGAVAIHSLRGQGYLAEQEVSFTLPGEVLNIEHRSIDRGCFMPGIVYAVRNIGRVSGLAVGLDTIMEF